MIIDTHCHLDDSSFDLDLDEVLQNAKINNIHKILIPGANPSDLPKAQKIAKKDGIYFAAGVHPHHIDDFDLDFLMKFALDDKCIAIGECGLDYYKLIEDKDKIKKEQKDVFISQIELAIKLNKPLILHIRDANEDSFQILKHYANDLKAGAVFHCFNGSPLLLDLCKIGKFYFGIGGVLTFKNAKNLVSILPDIPIDRLLLETDAPYLSPEPNRGKRNEPSFCIHTLNKMSEILQVQNLELILEENTKNLFFNL